MTNIADNEQKPYSSDRLKSTLIYSQLSTALASMTFLLPDMTLDHTEAFLMWIRTKALRRTPIVSISYPRQHVDCRDCIAICPTWVAGVAGTITVNSQASPRTQSSAFLHMLMLSSLHSFSSRKVNKYPACLLGASLLELVNTFALHQHSLLKNAAGNWKWRTWFCIQFLNVCTESNMPVLTRRCK